MEAPGLSAATAPAADEVFFTPEWLDAWRAAWTPDGDAGPWVGRALGPLRVLALPGGAVSDYKTTPEPPATTWDRAWDVLHLVDVRADDAGVAALVDLVYGRGARVRTAPSYACPRVALRGSWEDWWRARPRKTRYNLESAARKLAAAAGPLAVLACERAAELPRFFAVARTLYARSRAGRMDTGAFLTPAGRRFFDDWARVALARGWLDFCVLRAGDAPVAFSFGCVYGGKYYYHVPGYDPAYARWSPGTLLLVRLIERAHRRGLAELDLLKGDEPYKDRWATDVCMLRTVVVERPGARGRLAGGALIAGDAVRARLRASPVVRAALDAVVPRLRGRREEA